MNICEATSQPAWDLFLSEQVYRPFMQSWTMGEVYRDIGQPPIRLEMRDGEKITGICQALVIDARRGRHLTVPYGPVLRMGNGKCLPAGQAGEMGNELVHALKEYAKRHQCSFIRLSPFWPKGTSTFNFQLSTFNAPLHLLAEHIWYIPLTKEDNWQTCEVRSAKCEGRSEEDILKDMRKNHRNLIRRAEKEGVTISRSEDPLKDLSYFRELHDETRKRHHFTPYTNTFFEAQVRHFAPRNECTLYLAHYEGKVIASSIHMHAFGETSYHHGASTQAYSKIPASYLLQWTAIQDAIKRRDYIYSFWGIAPEGVRNHPFAGVTLFKKGFGGELLNLQHCMDIPVSNHYYLTRGFETLRKWRRGF